MIKLNRRTFFSTIPILMMISLFFSIHALAEGIMRWTAQTVYVPLYSQIYAEDRYKDKPFDLTATLAIRNTDPDNSLTLERVDYYDSRGKLIRKYLEKPTGIAPLASERFIVRESENSGGSGAKFIVQWKSEVAIVEPIVESVMIGTQLRQGISFLSRGKVIRGKTAR